MLGSDDLSSTTVGGEAVTKSEFLQKVAVLAGEMLAATNPLLSPGIPEDTEWVNFHKEDDA